MESSEPLKRPQLSAFLLLHTLDNVLICIKPVCAGSTVIIDGISYVLSSDTDIGHKIARVCLTVGDKILRYGMPIGSITADAKPGDHIHSHNLKSDYLPAHGRDAVRLQGIRS